MADIRKEVCDLCRLGPLPPEDDADPDLIGEYERLYRAINKPITDDEARALVLLLGSDGCFGLASSLVHLIETAPGWPLWDCLTNLDDEWAAELRNRVTRGGTVGP